MSGEADRLSAVMPLIGKPCDSNAVFELVAALHQHKDVGIQEVLCSKLYEAKSHEIEFYLPQFWYVEATNAPFVFPLERILS
jgi:hypothetical protein